MEPVIRAPNISDAMVYASFPFVDMDGLTANETSPSSGARPVINSWYFANSARGRASETARKAISPDLSLPAAAYSKQEGPVAVIGDARRGLFWIALFDGPQLAVPVFQVKQDELKLRVPLSADVVSPDAKRIGAVLAEEFEERFKDCGAPLAEGLARAMLANEKLLVKEPLPIYLNPAVRQD